MSNNQWSKRAIGYWAATGLLSLELVVGGVLASMRSDVVFGMRATMTHLGYPLYVMNILGAWKLLGAVALLAPRLPRLKEWAYAGVIFMMSGAVASHLWAGDGAGTILAPLVFIAIAAASWAMRPENRRSLMPHDAERSSAANAVFSSR